MANKTKITAEPGKQELTIEREFDAPRELVFKAYTDPELYVQWLGPRGGEMKMDKFNPVTGGSYRYIHKDDHGEYAFNGVYHYVNAPETIINTFEFEGLPERGHVATDFGEFIELPDGKTKFIGKSVFRSVEDRDGMVAMDMEKGVVEGFERLDELLAKLT